VRAVEGLSAHAGRGACTDAERRAALALHDELRARGHEAWVETHWVRPQRAAALAIGALLAAAGSLLSTAAPIPGLVLAVAGAAAMIVPPFTRRATQHVLTALPGEGVVLAVAAAYDVPRRSRRRIFRPVAVACALLIVAATAARVADFEPGWLGAVQLVPTIALIVLVAVAADVALSGWADDEGAPAAAAIALFDELTHDSPRELQPALLLVGAGNALPRGAARQLRREGLRAERVVLLQFVDGELGWAARHSQLRAAAERATAALGLEIEGRRLRPTRLPTVEIASGGAAVDLALGVVDALDADLSAREPAARPRA
jgi:peptidoglycan/LPS O-acetylase OafA/YrhL